MKDKTLNFTCVAAPLAYCCCKNRNIKQVSKQRRDSKQAEQCLETSGNWSIRQGTNISWIGDDRRQSTQRNSACIADRDDRGQSTHSILFPNMIPSYSYIRCSSIAVPASLSILFQSTIPQQLFTVISMNNFTSRFSLREYNNVLLPPYRFTRLIRKLGVVKM
jgi:hypothetical protein